MVSAALFVTFVLGMTATGLKAYNQELSEHGARAIALGAYLRSGHFLEALFENWESEFLQMGMFVLLTVWLFQKGSAESKRPDEVDPSDEDPRRHRRDKDAPWPVRQGGLALVVYEHSLSISLILLFFASLALHAVSGLKLQNAENGLHGQPAIGLGDYVTSAQFWFESFQNWQSEFLAVVAIVGLSIFLRQKGSTQSKPVVAPHAKTGH